MNMRQLAIAGVSLAMALVGGCDFLDNSKEEARRQEVEEARTRENLTRLRESMEQFIDGKLELARERLAETKRPADALRAELGELTTASQSAMNEKNAKGEELNWENRLLHLMRNQKVNEMAMKYLNSDFSREVPAFIEAVKTAREEERRYNEALRKCDEQYAGNIAESEKWAKATAEQRESEIARLNREIKALEANRKELLKENSRLSKGALQGGAQQNRERRDKISTYVRKIDDVDAEITKKRGQIDSLRHPEVNQRMEQDAVARTQQAQDRANANRERALQDIERRMKPKKSLSEVCSEYEQKTVGALQKTMASQLEKLQKEETMLTEKVKTLRELKISVPVSSVGELQRIRQAAEK